ncbi:MAG: tetratricopeptide repeat protein [Gemmatimonadota bacterium]|jgi:tetratricopeptide (TPR) repeat protein
MREMIPKRWLRTLSFAFASGVVLANVGCATTGPAPVTPAEIPALRERVIQEPGNGAAHLRLGAALLAAERCDAALPVAERGRALLPTDPAGPLIVGQCLEEEGRFDEALDLYAEFIDANPDAPGVSAVEGRRVIAFKSQARAVARSAIQNEENLQTPDPETVGVLPFLVEGDPTYHPLRVGLANMLTNDLAMIQRFTMVDRVQIGALLGELQLPPELVDPATAAQTGRLLGAGRMVLGTVSIPSEESMRIGSNIVLGTGEMVEPYSTTGNVGDVLEIEKDLAIRTAEALGYQLTDSEIQEIRQNVPGSIGAFLSFSRGLMAEDIGDFETAAAYYAEAIRLDPGFGEARQRLRGATGASVVSEAGAGEATLVGDRADQNLAQATGQDDSSLVGSLLASTLDSSILDLASHQAERATEHVGSNEVTEVVGDQPTLTQAFRAFILITIVIPR